MIVALVRDSSVVQVATVDTDDEYNSFALQYDAVIDITNMPVQPVVGWSFDGVKLTGPPVSMKITKLALRQRLTFSELVTLTRAGTFGDAIYNPYVAALMGNLQVTTYVDLLRPDTIAAVGLIVSLGLVTSDRANTILTTPPGPLEVYKG